MGMWEETPAENRERAGVLKGSRQERIQAATAESAGLLEFLVDFFCFIFE